MEGALLVRRKGLIDKVAGETCNRYTARISAGEYVSSVLLQLTADWFADDVGKLLDYVKALAAARTEPEGCA